MEWRGQVFAMPFMAVTSCFQCAHPGQGPHHLIPRLLLKATQLFYLLLALPYRSLSCIYICLCHFQTNKISGLSEQIKLCILAFEACNHGACTWSSSVNLSHLISNTNHLGQPFIFPYLYFTVCVQFSANFTQWKWDSLRILSLPNFCHLTVWTTSYTTMNCFGFFNVSWMCILMQCETAEPREHIVDCFLDLGLSI